MMDVDGNDMSNSSVKSMPDLYLPEKMQVTRPTSTDLILQDNEKPECLTMAIVKGSMGFGFTIADSAYGQKVSAYNSTIRRFLFSKYLNFISTSLLRLKKYWTSNDVKI